MHFNSPNSNKSKKKHKSKSEKRKSCDKHSSKKSKSIKPKCSTGKGPNPMEGLSSILNQLSKTEKKAMDDDEKADAEQAKDELNEEEMDEVVKEASRKEESEIGKGGRAEEESAGDEAELQAMEETAEKAIPAEMEADNQHQVVDENTANSAHQELGTGKDNDNDDLIETGNHKNSVPAKGKQGGNKEGIGSKVASSKGPPPSVNASKSSVGDGPVKSAQPNKSSKEVGKKNELQPGKEATLSKKPPGQPPPKSGIASISTGKGTLQPQKGSSTDTASVGKNLLLQSKCPEKGSLTGKVPLAPVFKNAALGGSKVPGAVCKGVDPKAATPLLGPKPSKQPPTGAGSIILKSDQPVASVKVLQSKSAPAPAPPYPSTKSLPKSVPASMLKTKSAVPPPSKGT